MKNKFVKGTLIQYIFHDEPIFGIVLTMDGSDPHKSVEIYWLNENNLCCYPKSAFRQQHWHDENTETFNS